MRLPCKIHGAALIYHQNNIFICPLFSVSIIFGYITEKAKYYSIIRCFRWRAVLKIPYISRNIGYLLFFDFLAE